jgi:saccharopine dehydrogenase-like NADP-dependent oxidoreductase
MNVVILGAGRVGSAMAIDLAKDKRFHVLVADRDERSLEALRTGYGIPGERMDVSLENAVRRVVAKADFVVSAVPGFLGFRTLEAILECGKNAVDIAFFPEDPFALDELARAKKVTAIVDCGVAPGMSNLLVGHVAAGLQRTDRVRIYVGGLPSVRQWPYEYKAGFSPIDVIEEYTRPARLVRGGKVEVCPALSELELIDFPDLGTLEAFVTDGLRTLARTIDAPDMIEKTMRYPGHAERMRMLRETGFFSETPVDVNGVSVRPLDVATRLLFPMWQMGEGDEDITIMRIVVEGLGPKGLGPEGLSPNGRGAEGNVRTTYDLVDRYDRTTGTTAMARTTGYTATTAVRMLAAGLWTEPGVVAPERLGQNTACTDFILAGLRERNVVYRESTQYLAD